MISVKKATIDRLRSNTFQRSFIGIRMSRKRIDSSSAIIWQRRKELIYISAIKISISSVISGFCILKLEIEAEMKKVKMQLS